MKLISRGHLRTMVGPMPICRILTGLAPLENCPVSPVADLSKTWLQTRSLARQWNFALTAHFHCSCLFGLLSIMSRYN